MLKLNGGRMMKLCPECDCNLFEIEGKVGYKVITWFKCGNCGYAEEK